MLYYHVCTTNCISVDPIGAFGGPTETTLQLFTLTTSLLFHIAKQVQNHARVNVKCLLLHTEQQSFQGCYHLNEHKFCFPMRANKVLKD